MASDETFRTKMTGRDEADREAGAVGVNLVLVLAFALFAVIILTWTTLSASQIDDRVKRIRGEVGRVDEELTNVPQLDQTSATAGEIDTATRNLSRQADEIKVTAQSIDRTDSSILSNATSINSTVGSIQGTLGAIQPLVRRIDAGVAEINAEVLRIRGAVEGIKGDTGSVVAEVGVGHAGGSSIHGHANNIDCAPALVALNGTACGAHP
jgi:hypothetical protein